MILFTKLSRYILILFIIYTVSIFIPKYYWLAFNKSIQPPRAYFSPVTQEFLETKVIDKKYKIFDSKAVEITRKEFERLTPFFNYRQLLFRDELPDTIQGIPVDAHTIRDNNIFLAVRPSDISKYQIQLFPLIESKPDGPDLNNPDENFRITDKLSFINCESNTVESGLSERFNEALVKNGFAFPAKNIFGNPTTMKPFDDGYFIVDSKDNLFHLMRVHDRPYCKKIDLPEGVKIKYILVKEVDLKEFHCIVIAEDSRVYLVLFDNYKIVQLPVKNYDNSKMRIELMGDMLYRQINTIDDGKVTSVLTDRNYNVLKTHVISWANNEATIAGKLFNYIFPFSLSLSNDNDSFINFYFKFSGWHLIIGNLISLIAAVIIFNSFNKRKKPAQAIDLLIIALAGLYGLIAVLLIRDEN